MDIFSSQQLKQLKQAQEEAETAKKTRERLSKILGIPEYEIVAPNLFRAAGFFGLLKKDSTGSVFDLFSSSKTNQPIEYKNYITSPVTTEQARLNALRRLLAEKTAGFTHWIASVINDRRVLLEEHDIALPLEDASFQGFQNTCAEAIEAYEECLDEVTPDCSDSNWILENLACLRHALFGFTDVVTAIKLAKQHVLLGKNKGLNSPNSLTPYEKVVLGVDVSAKVDPIWVEMSLQINHYTRDPTVVPFNTTNFIHKCCTPVLMFCPLEKILEYQLFSPYCNNNIGYHRGTKIFYILYDVKEGKRYWVADPNLAVFVKNIGGKLVCFLHKTFRQLLKMVYGTYEFRSSLHHPRHKEFLMLLRNWKLAKNLPILAKIITYLTMTYAEIYATDLDFFNIINPNMISGLTLRPIECKPLYDAPDINTDYSLFKMGIKGFSVFLKNIGCEWEDGNLSDFSGKIMAIDGIMYLYQTKLSPRDPVKLFIDFITKLKSNNIKPIFVMDGKYVHEKESEQAHRARKRYALKIIIEKLSTQLDEYKNKKEIGSDLSKLVESNTNLYINKLSKTLNIHALSLHIAKLMREISPITKHIKDVFLEVCQSFGIPVIWAKNDGEMLCALLVRLGKADVVYSHDSDVFVAGASHVIKHIDETTVKTLQLSRILEKSGLEFTEFIDMCILCGTDFNKRLHGIGPIAALNIIKKYKNLETFTSETEYNTSCLNFTRVREIYTQEDYTEDIIFSPPQKTLIYKILNYYKLQNMRSLLDIVWEL